MSEIPLSPDSSLFDAVKAIEASSKRLAVVVEKSGELVGTLTDGDIRRCLLRNGSLETNIKEAMSNSPVTALVSSSDGYIADLLSEHNIRALPLVDSSNNFVRVIHITELMSIDVGAIKAEGFSHAVIMAGGQGKRLRPLTENIPKPMVDIDGLPLLERQILRLRSMGVEHVYLSINYLGEVIEEYFKDGSDFGVNIEYLREDKELGTAGALSLIKESISKPILVMNGDVLTTSNFTNLYNFHTDHNATITVAAVDYHVEIPYGVIHADGPYICELREKPSQRFLCNAGIYAISPNVIPQLPKQSFYNMTDLIERYLKEKQGVVVFPVHEYWTDIGTPADLAKACKKYSELVDEHG